MSAFYLASSPRGSSQTLDTDSSSSFKGDDHDYESDLPFPQPISRSAFSSSSFSPSTFLSNLSDRHQTLSDLQSELRELSRSLNAELLDLVNENYVSFLHLGTSLHGGDEKVEEVRLGVLGFQKDVKGIRAEVDERAEKMRVLLEEKKMIKREVGMAHDLLDVATCVEEMEHRLMLDRDGKVIDEGRLDRQGNAVSKDEGDDYDDNDDDDGDDDDDDFHEADDLNQRNDGGDSDSSSTDNAALSSLERCAYKYKYTLTVIQRVGKDHPLVNGLEGRLSKIRETIALDLKTLQKSILSSSSSSSSPSSDNRLQRQKQRFQSLCKLLQEGGIETGIGI
ncbi:hypothetical protein KEM54_004009 [Ascosphaera aggregata]|nr:hypothetical protein KEM54_004009 [Ascosphaera aggregata]